MIFYLIRGMIKIEGGRSGRTIVRFNAFERFVHWMTATCFIMLALSGLNITFGKALLLPLIGAGGVHRPGRSSRKYAHNYLSFPFTLGVVADLPDVDRRQYPEPRPTSSGSSAAAASSATGASAGRTASTPARR